MGNLSKYRAGSPYKIGDLRALNAAVTPRYFVEDSAEFLATGVLRSNAGNAYSDLLTKFKNGYGVHVLLTADYTYSGTGPVAGASPLSNVSDIYYLTSNYVWLPPIAASATQWSYASALAGAWTRGSPTGAGAQVLAHCKVGAAPVVVLCTSAASPDNLNSVANSGAATARGATATAAFTMAASNGTNYAVVAAASNSNSANQIATSPDGVNWTNRTGSAALLTTMRGLHYAAHINQYLLWGQGASGGSFNAIVKSTDGFTLSVARAEATDYALPNTGTGGSQHYAASSPSETLIAAIRNSDGLVGFLRTTDGTTWSFVSPWSSDTRAGNNSGVVPTTHQCVRYDSVRGRFYIPFNNAVASTAQSDNAAYAYSADGGITWDFSGALGAGLKGFAGFANPNSQDIAIVADVSSGAFPGTNGGIVPGTKLVGTPNYVGTVRQMTPGGAQVTYSTNLLSPVYYVRIK